MIDLVPALPNLRRFAHKLLRHDRQGVDDLVQVTALRALEKQHQFCPGTNLTAWLMSIMKSAYVNEVERSVHRRKIDATLIRSAHAADDPAIGLVVRDVVRAFKDLTPEQRATIIALRVEGLTPQEAATMLGVPVNTVKTRDCRGRAVLRDRVGAL